MVSVLALLGAGAVVAGAQDDKAKSGTEIKIVFDNAFGLTKGGDFRVGGVKAGSTTDFKATDTNPPKAEVTAKITEPGFTNFRRDASCTIKPQSLIGEYYVDCQPGSPGQPKLKGRIPVAQTSSTIPQDLVNNVLRRPYKERLRLVINELGTGLAGRPKDLQAVLRRAHPGLRETSATLRILGRQNEHDRELHPRLRHGGHAAGGAQEGGVALHRRGGRHRHDHRHTPQRAGFHVQQAAGLPGRAGPDHAAPGRAHRRADPAAGRRPARRPQPGHLPDPPRAVRPGLAARDPLARQSVGQGHQGVPKGRRGGGRAQADRARRRRRPPSRWPSSWTPWTTAAAPSTPTRAARSARRPPATRPTAARPTAAASPGSSRSGPTSSGRACR